VCLSEHKTVIENLKVDAALLSRFDLVFVLLDRPDAELDRILSEHVLGKSPVVMAQATTQLSQHLTGTQTLSQKLTAPLESEPLAPRMLREYIAFARKQPVRLTEEACALLQSFYLDLRKQRQSLGDEMLPITTRHLESLIRLCQARARMALRSFVTVEDAGEIIELMRFSLLDDIRSSGLARGRKPAKKASKSSVIKQYVAELLRVSANTGQVEYSQDQLQQIYHAMNLAGQFDSFCELLDWLNENGYLLRKSTGSYKLLVT